jgi:hypothetical protein
VHVTNREHLSRSELERQIVEHLVYQNADYRDTAAAWARIILDVKNMAMESDLPANIADHIRRFLSDQQSAVSDQPSTVSGQQSAFSDQQSAISSQPAAGDTVGAVSAVEKEEADS